MSEQAHLSLHKKLYTSLYRIRRVEEEVVRIYPTDKIKSPVHLSIGQEAVSVGVCEALKEQDVAFGSYRSHALYIAKGGDLKGMMAELYGKSTGSSKGKGGSMHLVDVSKGLICTSAVVATTIPTAIGYAYALKYQGKNSVVASFLGDGATEEGVFYESLNFAAIKKLPVFFICENNSYAIHTHQNSRQVKSDICERVASFGIPAIKIEGNDVLKIYDTIRDIREKMCKGEIEPHFIECETYRWKEHVGPSEDYALGYRTKEELKPWVENDQVKEIGKLLSKQTRKELESAVEKEIKEAIASAEKSDFPSLAELYTDLFQG